MSHLTDEEINTLENRVFRLECEKMDWRMFRDEVKTFLEMRTTFGFNTDEEVEKLRKVLESIKYH